MRPAQGERHRELKPDLWFAGSILEDIYNGTICMDSRYETAKHYNIKGLYSHLVIETTAK